MMMKPVTRKKGDLGPSTSAKRKKKRRESWVYFLERLKVLGFCFLGVLGHRVLDIAGEQLVLTAWLERREIPAGISRKKAIAILRRMAFIIDGYDDVPYWMRQSMRYQG
jgi:hypothetical protein